MNQKSPLLQLLHTPDLIPPWGEIPLCRVYAGLFAGSMTRKNGRILSKKRGTPVRIMGSTIVRVLLMKGKNIWLFIFCLQHAIAWTRNEDEKRIRYEIFRTFQKYK
jgi:hypothetical protein